MTSPTTPLPKGAGVHQMPRSDLNGRPEMKAQLVQSAMMRLAEIEQDPEHQSSQIPRLLEEISNLKRDGVVIPNELMRFESEYFANEEDDFFDNMPV